MLVSPQWRRVSFTIPLRLNSFIVDWQPCSTLRKREKRKKLRRVENSKPNWALSSKATSFKFSQQDLPFSVWRVIVLSRVILDVLTYPARCRPKQR